MTSATLTPKAATTLLRSIGTVAKSNGLYRVNLLHAGGARGWMTESEFLQFAERELAPKTALAPVEPTVIGVAMMGVEEARAHIEMMRTELDLADRAIGNFRQRAAEFADREGWRALGYTSTAEAINAELGTTYSKSYLSRLLKAAEIERILELPIGNSVPESQLRPLGRLDAPDQQREAWQAANAATNGAPTAQAVEQAAAFVDAQRRFAALGWKLVRHGVWYKLSKPDGEHYATTPDLAPQLRTLESFERHAQVLRADPNKPDPSEPPAPALMPDPNALPPLDQRLMSDWTVWRNDDGMIGVKHITGYKLSGTDATALEAQALSLTRPLFELGEHGWHVNYDASAEGRSDLHPYVATHDEFNAISARDLMGLALAAWWARNDDPSRFPDMPNEVIEGLWKQGFDWTGTAWVRGYERVDESTPEGELRYLAGLGEAPKAYPLLPPDFADAQQRAKRVGLWIDAKLSGAYVLANEGTNENAGGAVDWPSLLDLLSRKELAKDLIGPRGSADKLPVDVDWNAVARLTYKLGALSDAHQALGVWREIGALLSPALPPLPPRPRVPRSADVSDQLAYLGQLESYALALEARLIGAEKR